MRAHVLITDCNTLPIAKEYNFWGVGVNGIPDSIDNIFKSNLENSRLPYFDMLTDILGTRIGDIVFLYERKVGFHGVYKVISSPFFDPTPIECIGKNWPFRFEIECINYFINPVPEDYLFSTKEYESRFWSWFYRKIQGPRGINTFDPEAAETLIELLVKVNGNVSYRNAQGKKYPSKNKIKIQLPLETDGKIGLEVLLRAWIIANIDGPENAGMREIFGPVSDIEWFANNVPYHVTRKSIDILCFHKNDIYTGFPLRYKYSVVELKRDKADENDILQCINYSKWVTGRLAGSDIQIVQPVIIAYDFSETALQKARNSDFNEKRILCYKYHVEDRDLKFIRIDY